MNKPRELVPVVYGEDGQSARLLLLMFCGSRHRENLEQVNDILARVGSQKARRKVVGTGAA